MHLAGHAQQCCLPHLGLEAFKRSIFLLLLLLNVNTVAAAAASRRPYQAIAAAITASSSCYTMPCSNRGQLTNSSITYQSSATL
jgi:hypothetical protein